MNYMVLEWYDQRNVSMCAWWWANW